jgi:hypothetical protein
MTSTRTSSRTSTRIWAEWREYFARNARRPLPPVGDRADIDAALPAASVAALAGSLARFQIGETGEGRIVGEIGRSRLGGIDGDYRRAVALFVKEEGRHARVLAAAVRMLGGRLLATTWTRGLFVVARRLAGVRFKLLVLLAAEVIGIGFYGALAAHLPPGALSAALEQIAADEQAHLLFHRDFFRVQAGRGWRRALFRIWWGLIGHAAALVVLLDHRRTLRALGIPAGALARRLFALVAEASGAAAAAPAAHAPREARASAKVVAVATS